jgi:hypothetical protein
MEMDRLLTYSHIEGSPCEGPCERADELARDAKVADLELALTGDEDVRGLDI